MDSELNENDSLLRLQVKPFPIIVTQWQRVVIINLAIEMDFVLTASRNSVRIR